MATTVARLEAVLSAQTRDFDRAMDRSQSRMGKVGKAAGVAGLAIAGGLAIGLKKSVDEAMEAERVQKRLEQAFRTAGLSIKPYAKSIEEADKATRKLGFSDEDAKESLGSLLVATKSYKKSREDLNVAMDIARFKNIDLLSATKMLTMAQAGSQRATKQLGLSIQPVTSNYDTLKASMGKTIDEHEKMQLAAAKLIDKQATAAQVIDTVRQKLGGQAEAYSKTAAGGMAQFHAQTQELFEQLGTMLLPAITSVTTHLASLMELMQKHKGTVKALTVALAALAAALLTARAAQLLMNLAVLANPYVAATVAIIAMSAALVVLWNRSKQARTIIEIVTGVITMGLSVAIIEAIRHWDGLTSAINKALTPMRVLANVVAAALATAFDGIHSAITGLNAGVHALVRALEKVVDAFKWIIGAAGKIGGALGKVGGVVGSVAGKFGDASGSLGKARRGPGGASGVLGGSGAAEGKQFNVGSQLWDEIGIGEKLGLRVTSGYRPGAVTKHGTPSDHGTNPSSAVDMSGSSGSMARMFMALLGRKEVRQVFYDPLGSIFAGIRSSYREGGHSDHIHIAEYDKGGWLQPGLTLAANNTGRPERVGGGDTYNVVFPNYVGGERELEGAMQRIMSRYGKRNARPLGDAHTTRNQFWSDFRGLQGA